jgi:hypothetical protein
MIQDIFRPTINKGTLRWKRDIKMKGTTTIVMEKQIFSTQHCSNCITSSTITLSTGNVF